MLFRLRRFACFTLATATATAYPIGAVSRPAYAADPPAPPLMVKAKHKPSDATWKDNPSRTVETLPGFSLSSPTPPLDKWGGRNDKKAKATGFFRVEKQGSRWVMVDPDGGLFVFVGLNSVSQGRGKTSLAALPVRFPGGDAAWAQGETTRFRDMGFNNWGAWSAWPVLRQASAPLPYVEGPTEWQAKAGMGQGFVRGFGGKLGIVRPGTGHSNYVGDCLPVFHPDFEKYCNDYAKPFAKLKDDPYLIGYLTDNELPVPKLDKYLALDPKDPALRDSQKAAQSWLDARKGKPATIADATDEDKDAWTAFVYDRYFSVTTKAIRKADPNHLCLGCRLYSSEKRMPGVFQAAGKYLDVIAINHYGSWNPTMNEITRWTEWSGKPTIITEWYAKGADSGFANTGGAGWLVQTQRDRGIFYQTFTLALMQSQTCVGWHWFKYMDNDPTDTQADPSNTDSNKGIVTAKYEEYKPLADAMRDLNHHVYSLVDYFDALPKSPQTQVSKAAAQR